MNTTHILKASTVWTSAMLSCSKQNKQETIREYISLPQEKQLPKYLLNSKFLS